MTFETVGDPGVEAREIMAVRGEGISIPVLLEVTKREGYVLVGLFTDSECTASYDYFDPVTEDLHIYPESRIIGDAEPTQIHDTNGKPIKLTITIPDSMKSAPIGYTRTFRIIRVHNGVATVMAEGTGATLEVSSDKFSSYFLVYKDTKEAVTTEATTATSTTEATAAASTSDATTAASTTEAAKTSPKTGDSAPVAVMIILMSLTAFGFYATKKRK